MERISRPERLEGVSLSFRLLSLLDSSLCPSLPRSPILDCLRPCDGFRLNALPCLHKACLVNPATVKWGSIFVFAHAISPFRASSRLSQSPLPFFPYALQEGFDKDESLWGRRGRAWGGAFFRKPLPPPFSKRSGAGTEEGVPTPFEERGDILRGMDAARTRSPSQGKGGEPGWRRKPGIRVCITRRAAVKRPTRRLWRTESQGVNPVLREHRQGSVDVPMFMETRRGEENSRHHTTPCSPGRSKTPRVTAVLNDVVSPNRGSIGAATNREETVPMKTPISMVSAKP